MISKLFGFYSRSPRFMRQIIVHLSGVIRFLLSPFLKRVSINGYVMELDTNDNACFRYYSHRGNYEHVLMDSFLTIIKKTPGCYVLDIGASYGAFSLASANISQSGLTKKIYSFEPDSRSAGALQRSLETNNWEHLVTLENVLVGDEEGEADLLVSKRSSTSNRSFSSHGDSLKFSAIEKRKTIVIDKYLENIEHLDQSYFIIKMDIEGNELKALRGMKNILNNCKGFALYCEYYPVGIIEVGMKPEDLWAFLGDFEFDHVMVEGENEYEKLDGLEQLIENLKRHASHIDSRGVGTAGNYLVARGMDF